MEELQAVLLNTFNPNKILRETAETRLAEIIRAPGAFPALIGITCTKGVSHDVRVAAAIAIKNNSREFWLPEATFLNPTEKEAIKSALLQNLLGETDNVLRGVFAEAIRNIADTDFPERF